MNLTLHDIGSMRAVLDGWIEEAEGELTPAIDDLLAGWEGDFATKAERVALYIREREREADANRAERDVFTARMDHHAGAAKRLKAYLQRELERVGATKIEGQRATIALQKNPPSVKGELSPEQLEALYHNGPAIVRHAPESFTLDRKACLDAFKAGATLPEGLTVEQSLSLRIR